MPQVEPYDGKEHQIGNDDVQNLEFFAGLVVEVRFDFKSGGFKNNLVLFVEVGEPILLGGVFALLFGITDGFGCDLTTLVFRFRLQKYSIFADGKKMEFVGSMMRMITLDELSIKIGINPQKIRNILPN